MSRNIPQNPFERRYKISILGMMARHRPAYEERATSDKPENLHAEFHICQEGNKKTCREEDKSVTCLSWRFPTIEAESVVSVDPRKKGSRPT